MNNARERKRTFWLDRYSNYIDCISGCQKDDKICDINSNSKSEVEHYYDFNNFLHSSSCVWNDLEVTESILLFYFVKCICCHKVKLQMLRRKIAYSFRQLTYPHHCFNEGITIVKLFFSYIELRNVSLLSCIELRNVSLGILSAWMYYLVHFI